MKKITLLLLILCFNFGYSQLLFSEGFTGYNSGNLAGQGGWTKFGTGPDCSVNSTTPLNYPGFNWGGGNYVEFTTNSSTTSRVYRDFSDTTASLTTPGTVIYCALLLNLSTTYTTATNYFFSLGQAPGTSNYYAKLFAQQITPTTYYLGVSKSSNTANFSSKILNTNQTYLVVIRYNVNNTGLNQTGNTCYMWINPVGSNQPDTSAADAKVWAGQPDYTSAHCSAVIWHNRGVNNPLGSIDGIRVGFSPTSSLQAWNYVNLGPLPVELTSFTVNSTNGKVFLNWTTASEKNNLGFNVERKTPNSSWHQIGFIKGNGTTSSNSEYSFKDENPSLDGKSFYRLKQVDFDGSFTYSSEVQVEVISENSFKLEQNYPNPFNPATVLKFNISKPEFVNLTIYNLIGQKVQTVVNEFLSAGNYKYNVDASNLESGIYFYKLETRSFSQTRKMTLIK